jgi:hypothetical protein
MAPPPGYFFRHLSAAGNAAVGRHFLHKLLHLPGNDVFDLLFGRLRHAG